MEKKLLLRLQVELWRKLKAQAERESRSLHGQIIWILSRAVEGEV